MTTDKKIKGHFIGPNDELPNGTKVSIGRKRGVVVKCETHRAIPCGEINVHTVKLTEKTVYKWGNNYSVEQLEKPELWSGNYTGIFVIDN